MPTGITITIENYQIIGSDTLRLDVSVSGRAEQDGKIITLNHERETFYVNKKRPPRGSLFEQIFGTTTFHDPRQSSAI